MSLILLAFTWTFVAGDGGLRSAASAVARRFALANGRLADAVAHVMLGLATAIIAHSGLTLPTITLNGGCHIRHRIGDKL